MLREGLHLCPVSSVCVLFVLAWPRFWPFRPFVSCRCLWSFSCSRGNFRRRCPFAGLLWLQHWTTNLAVPTTIALFGLCSAPVYFFVFGLFESARLDLGRCGPARHILARLGSFWLGGARSCSPALSFVSLQLLCPRLGSLLSVFDPGCLREHLFGLDSLCPFWGDTFSSVFVFGSGMSFVSQNCMVASSSLLWLRLVFGCTLFSGRAIASGRNFVLTHAFHDSRLSFCLGSLAVFASGLLLLSAFWPDDAPCYSCLLSFVGARKVGSKNFHRFPSLLPRRA